jgi:hypothetical protein
MNITKAFEKEVAAFKKKTAVTELIKIEHKFGGLDIYRPTALSTYRTDIINKALVAGGTAYHVDLMIQIARTEEGKPMFAEAQRATLMKKVESSVLKNIAAELLDAVKDSGSDDPNG